MNSAELARFQYEEMLRYNEITDEADAIADTVIKLSLYYKEADIDKLMDMPSARMSLLVKEIERQNQRMKDRIDGYGSD